MGIEDRIGYLSREQRQAVKRARGQHVANTANPDQGPAPNLSQGPGAFVAPGQAPNAGHDGSYFYQNPRSYMLGSTPNYGPEMASAGMATANQTADHLNSIARESMGQAGARAGDLLGIGGRSEQYGMSAAAGVQDSASMLGGMGGQLYGLGGQAINRAGPQLDFAGQSSALQSSQQNAYQLGGIEAQQGASGAQAMLQQGRDMAMADQLAMARSGRGMGGGVEAMAQAQRANAATAMNAGNQSAMLAAQEQAAWRQRQAQNLNAAAGIQQGAAQQWGNMQGMVADTHLRQQAANDEMGARLFGMGMEGQSQALQGGLAAGQLGLGALQQRGSLVNQAGVQQHAGATLAGQLSQNAGAAQMAGLGFGVNLAQAQAQASMQRENDILKEYGIRAGVAVQDSANQQQMVGSGIGAAGAIGGAVIGSLAGPAGTAAGGALGGMAANAAYQYGI